MRDEISAAVIFLARLVEKGENFNPEQLEDFKRRLSELLTKRFENHWFPDYPQRGQGYRCIRVNKCDRHDATLEKAAKACGIKYEDMKLPVELTIWVDPNEVCCRFGENKGSYCTLASFNDKVNVMELSEQIRELEVELKNEKPKEEVDPDLPPEDAPKVEEENKKVQSPLKESKSQVAALTTNQLRPNTHNGRKHSQGSPKQKNRRGGNMGGFHGHHVMPSWYNVTNPHWMGPSPPPYHPLLRRPAVPLHTHSRYHWLNKSMLKV